MLTPTVTELPLPLDQRDSFLDRAPQVPGSSPTRELDHRRSDGIDVQLLWSESDDRVLLAVSDSKTGHAFSIEVEPGDALEAFHHPYSYAAFKREHRLAA
jgi:hypothetical protein